jgi:hypothetical protein
LGGEVCPESGNRVKNDHLAQGETLTGRKTDRIKRQKTMVFVKKFVGKCYRTYMN